MTRSFTFVLLLVVCFVIVGPLAAQDAPTPEPVGLRPDAPNMRCTARTGWGRKRWKCTQEPKTQSASPSGIQRSIPTD